ncbi:hypothetical protein QAD02_004506 [Eretmocerus hayati]|uniref:Uncharacterized protein n=1 Tax=Eretmocerus hayati TaxID=131215 RepID=A0ACC2NQ83_9HYME|nr:hypothetical protein QAD02_004506 [Eretmocerus hayati]
MIHIIVILCIFGGVLSGVTTTTEKTLKVLEQVLISSRNETKSKSQELGGTTTNATLVHGLNEDPVGTDTIMKERIIRGIPVNELHYPYVVSMYDQKNPLLCGGTIITSRIILTAGHCVDTKPTHVRTSISNKKYKVIKTFTHEEFDRDSLINDIGLLLLNNQIEKATIVPLQEHISPVPLGTRAYALGWGLTEYGSFSRKLRLIEVPIIPPKICAQNYGLTGYWVCTDSHFLSTCNGDSGGPLMMDGVQIGITSFGADSCELGWSSVFTRVSAYYDWIEHKINISEKLEVRS